MSPTAQCVARNLSAAELSPAIALAVTSRPRGLAERTLASLAGGPEAGGSGPSFQCILAGRAQRAVTHGCDGG